MLPTWSRKAAIRSSCYTGRLLRPRHLQQRLRRNLLTLAIETSCDDTAVAVLETHDASPKNVSVDSPAAELHFNERITANNLAYEGIHPIIALESHEQHLARLVQQAIGSLPPAGPEADRTSIIPDGETPRRKPDFISVTRGPGMRSNVATGLDTAKGLATAWQIPLVGVHHMQAHLLTPRLEAALEPGSANRDASPPFPFLSLLASGGHTLLVHSRSRTSHRVLASTQDIAIGNAIDLIARDVVPVDVRRAAKTITYGPVLERFAFPAGAADYGYVPPRTRHEEMQRRATKWGWGIGPPLVGSKSGIKSRAMEYSFNGLQTAVKQFMVYGVEKDGSHSHVPRAEDVCLEERRDLAREAMRVAFEHLASRVVLAMGGGLGVQMAEGTESAHADSLVVSGGVAANGYLRTMLVSSPLPVFSMTLHGRSCMFGQS